MALLLLALQNEAGNSIPQNFLLALCEVDTFNIEFVTDSQLIWIFFLLYLFGRVQQQSLVLICLVVLPMIHLLMLLQLTLLTVYLSRFALQPSIFSQFLNT